MAELAKITHSHRNTLLRHPAAASVEKDLEPIIKIFTVAEDLTGDADRAIVWFRHQPIAGHDGRTAIELTKQGHAAAVLAHLEDLTGGDYA